MGNTVNVSIKGGPNVYVPWIEGMNAQKAMEEAFDQESTGEGKSRVHRFTYALEYFGHTLGNLVLMINGTYETFTVSSAPYYFWEFYINGNASSVGIDNAILKNGDEIQFALERYHPDKHAHSTVQHKYQARSKHVD